MHCVECFCLSSAVVVRMISRFLYPLLVFLRIPGNAFSFWLRTTWRWSRGMPELEHEPKADLYAYLHEWRPAAEQRAAALHDRYQLAPLAQCSTAPLYRKNLYLLDILEQASAGLPLPAIAGDVVSALDVGAQDWYYVFALERWLHQVNHCPVFLKGLEVDGHARYSNLHTRREYALAYAAQTGNPHVVYEVGDFLRSREVGYDFVFLCYPLLIRYQVLLWGLPLRFFAPQRFVDQAVTALQPGGWLVCLFHNPREQAVAMELVVASGKCRILREGQVRSDLVNFQGEVNENRFSIWQKC